ncbi:secretin N-terminal domain-containing protein [Marinobacter sp. JSM 1782161]|uniref:secretin N-terminal domain-containing protein n=1 Tax=Marinobacter sp. JSM 1782161 TaxID=2685906 RepID=UPI00140393C5|nr:secretin N-terminal domain-containing protein [Marinobacter sp. JSM 1782161]
MFKDGVFTRGLVTLLLLLMTHAALAAPQLRTFSLNNRPADDIAAQLRQLYPQDQLNVTAQGQNLAVRAEPQVLNEIEQLIGTMDVAPVQLRITVRSGQGRSGQRQGGGVSINNGNVSVQAENKVTTTRRNQEQTLVVQDGQSAHIKSGQVRALPVAVQGGFNPAVLLDQVDISSGFVITPQVISRQQIQLQIMAFDNTPQGDLPAGYETEGVVTMRRVAPGDWFELGSTQTRQGGNQSGITYEVGGSSQRSQHFEVKVEVM